MKKTLLLALSVTILWACGNSEEDNTPQFSINGTLSNADSIWVTLQKRDNGEWVKLDSSQVTDGQFSISGVVDIPEFHYLKLGEGRNYKGIFLDNSTVTFAGDMDSLDNVSINGSAIHDKYEAYQDAMKPFNERIKALYPKYDLADSLGDKEMEKEIDAEYETISDEQTAATVKIIKENSNNNLGPYLAMRTFYNDKSIDDLRTALSAFDSTLDGSTYVKDLTQMLNTWESVAIGQPAVIFTQNDTTGAPISLGSFKGQYLLIDFWASWCGPCRAENPNVVAMYNDLHDKGFEILGVSFDTSKEKWMKAIEDDKLTWPQVSDLGGWGNAAGELYGVKSIPHTVLLDKDGKIIAKNLRGDDLREKLEEILL